MKIRILLFSIIALVASVALNAQIGIFSGKVERVSTASPDVFGNPRYRGEAGTLAADGFTPASSVLIPYLDGTGPTEEQVTLVSGRPLVSKVLWDAAVGHRDEYSIGEQRYLGSVPYYEVFYGSVVPTPTPTPVDGKIINLSFRAVVPKDGQIIPGVVLKRDTTILVRVSGPTLAKLFEVPGTLADPKIQVLDKVGAVVASNDDWDADATEAVKITAAEKAAGAWSFFPGYKDAEILISLKAGNYTFFVQGAAGTTGEIIFELFEVPAQ